LYLRKVLKDSGLLYIFEDFFKNNNKDKFKEMKTYYVVKHFEDEGTGEWLETSLRRLTA
jgi:hypothetical protein